MPPFGVNGWEIFQGIINVLESFINVFHVEQNLGIFGLWAQPVSMVTARMRLGLFHHGCYGGFGLLKDFSIFMVDSYVCIGQQNFSEIVPEEKRRLSPNFNSFNLLKWNLPYKPWSDLGVLIIYTLKFIKTQRANEMCQKLISY